MSVETNSVDIMEKLQYTLVSKIPESGKLYLLSFNNYELFMPKEWNYFYNRIQETRSLGFSGYQISGHDPINV